MGRQAGCEMEQHPSTPTEQLEGIMAAVPARSPSPEAVRHGKFKVTFLRFMVGRCHLHFVTNADTGERRGMM